MDRAQDILRAIKLENHNWPNIPKKSSNKNSHFNSMTYKTVRIANSRKGSARSRLLTDETCHESFTAQVRLKIRKKPATERAAVSGKR
jgi:hypothetical protein